MSEYLEKVMRLLEDDPSLAKDIIPARLYGFLMSLELCSIENSILESVLLGEALSVEDYSLAHDVQPSVIIRALTKIEVLIESGKAYSYFEFPPYEIKVSRFSEVNTILRSIRHSYEEICKLDNIVRKIYPLEHFVKKAVSFNANDLEWHTSKRASHFDSNDNTQVRYTVITENTLSPIVKSKLLWLDDITIYQSVSENMEMLLVIEAKISNSWKGDIDNTKEVRLSISNGRMRKTISLSPSDILLSCVFPKLNSGQLKFEFSIPN